MSFPAGSSLTLQTEFLHFLEQKLVSVQDELSKSEKDKNKLQRTLNEAEKRSSEAENQLVASQEELEALRARLASAQSHGNELQSVRDGLQQTSKRLAKEEERRKDAEHALEERNLEVKALALRLNQCNADLELRKSAYHKSKVAIEQTQTQESRRESEHLAEVARLRQVVSAREKEISSLKETLDNAQKSGRRNELNATTAKLIAELSLATVFSELNTTKKNLETLRDQSVREFGRVKFERFLNKMRSLPTPPGHTANELFDLSSSEPTGIYHRTCMPPAFRYDVDLARLRQMGSLTLPVLIVDSTSVLWVPYTQHAIFPCAHKRDSHAVKRAKYWCTSSPLSMSPAPGKYEVFHEAARKLYYIGRYDVFHGASDCLLQDIVGGMFFGNRQPADMESVADSLCTQSLPPLLPGQGGAAEKAIFEMYMTGKRPISELFGLQCIGVNRRLQEEFHRSVEDISPQAQRPPRKRKASSDAGQHGEKVAKVST